MSRRSTPGRSNTKINDSHGLEQLLVTSLQAGVDTSVIALWLEHAGVRSTDGYLHADITVKEKALAIPAEAQTRPLPASRQDPHVPRKPMAIPSHKPPISPDTQP